jgi:hypothetical protein
MADITFEGIGTDLAAKLHQIRKDHRDWSDDKLLRELVNCAEGEGRV